LSDITPLNILLTAMREKWKAHDVDGAIALAKIAAPQMHLKAPVARPMLDVAGVSDELVPTEHDIRARDADGCPDESR
jgi:hypothetical protein